MLLQQETYLLVKLFSRKILLSLALTIQMMSSAVLDVAGMNK